MADKIKKIKKRAKPLPQTDKRRKPGRIDNKDLEELSEDQEAFAAYLGMGIDPDLAGEWLGLTAYKVKAWQEIPLLQQKVERYRRIHKLKNIEDIIGKEVPDIVFLACQDLKKRIRTSELSESLLMKIVNSGMAAAGRSPLDGPTEEVMKLTETRTRTLEKKGEEKLKLAFDPASTVKDREEEEIIVEGEVNEPADTED